MKTILIAVAVFLLLCSCHAAEQSPGAVKTQDTPAAKATENAAPADGAKAQPPADAGKTQPAPATKTPAAKDAAPTTQNQPAKAETPKPAKPVVTPVKSTFKTEAEISGLTSETTDQFYTRINLRKTGGPKNWYLRAGYGATKTRTYSGNKTYETDIGTYTLDGQYRVDGKRDYKFISATANIRTRSPYTVTYGDKSGYYLVSAGLGRKLMPGLEGELSIANIATYDDETEHKISPVYSLRWVNNLTSAMSLTGHAYIVSPLSAACWWTRAWT